MRVEILCTGDEILTGKTINTNHSHIAQRLGEAGLEVCWGTTVGDDRASLLSTFRLAAARADAVIVNGGLGPKVGRGSGRGRGVISGGAGSFKKKKKKKLHQQTNVI